MRKYLFLIAFAAIGVCANAQLKVYNNGSVGINIPANSSPNTNTKLCVDGGTELYGNVGIGHAASTGIASSLRVRGPVSFECNPVAGIVGPANELITFMVMNDYTGAICPTIYGFDNSIQIGLNGSAIRMIWAYLVNYHTLYQVSDIRLKENIRPCTSFLSKLKEVQAYNYNFTDEYFKGFTTEDKQRMQKTEYGFLAQELQKVFPELVRTDDSNNLAINYVGMIPILTTAINELQQVAENRDSIINVLQQEVASLKTALNACCNGKNQKSMGGEEDGNDPAQQFNLGSGELKVYQNVPNPFNVTTMIECYVPANIQKAELCVYNMLGVQLKCLTVSGRGTTTVQIQAGELAEGVYTYLLIGDGKTSDAKQMILTK